MLRTHFYCEINEDGKVTWYWGKFSVITDRAVTLDWVLYYFHGIVFYEYSSYILKFKTIKNE